MKLFDNIQRTDARAKQYGEGIFEFMNRVDRPEYDRIRATMEDWMTRYPTREQSDLVSRFTGNDRVNHFSAFFELILHECLLCLGCKVEVHPPLSCTSKRPDFLVEDVNGTRFYLEPTVTDDANQAKSDARLDELLKHLNDKLDNCDFLIGMILHDGIPARQPSTRKIVAFLKQRLTELNPDEITKQMGGPLASAVRWPYDHDGLNVEFYPIPRPEERRGIKPSDSVGMRTESSWGVDHAVQLFESLHHKADYYGELSLPFVIAVNNIHDAIDHLDLSLALFGTDEPEELIRCFAIGQAAPPATRKGLFCTGEGPKRLNVSGFLHFNALFPWSVGAVNARLFHHPWATYPLGNCLNAFRRLVPLQSGLEWQSGQYLYEILRLWERWPVLGQPSFMTS